MEPSVDQVSIIGLDIAKQVFQAHGADASNIRMEASPQAHNVRQLALVERFFNGVRQLGLTAAFMGHRQQLHCDLAGLLVPDRRLERFERPSIGGAWEQLIAVNGGDKLCQMAA